jgi:hypothetical protein
VCSGFALEACTTPLRLGLCPRGLQYALAACAMPLKLKLCPRSSRYALAAWAMPSRLGFALAAHATCSRLGLRRWRRWQWKQRQRMLALAARAMCSQARALPSRLGFARFAVVAHATHSDSGFTFAARLRPHTTIKQHSSGRKRCFGSAATYLPQR